MVVYRRGMRKGEILRKLQVEKHRVEDQVLVYRISFLRLYLGPKGSHICGGECTQLVAMKSRRTVRLICRAKGAESPPGCSIRRPFMVDDSRSWQNTDGSPVSLTVGALKDTTAVAGIRTAVVAPSKTTTLGTGLENLIS